MHHVAGSPVYVLGWAGVGLVLAALLWHCGRAGRCLAAAVLMPFCAGLLISLLDTPSLVLRCLLLTHGLAWLGSAVLLFASLAQRLSAPMRSSRHRPAGHSG